MTPRTPRLRSVEAEGFYQGVHLVPAAPMETEIAAQFDGEAHKVRHDVVDSAKEIEGTLKVLENRKPDVQRHWQRLEAETNGLRPEMGKPLVAVAMAILAIVGETLLLAPVMDGFGIAEPLWQAVAAGTLVAVASGLIHIALGRVPGLLQGEPRARKAASGPVATIATVTFGAFALTLITVLGWWRAGEMIFAADAQRGAWAGFLHQHESLTKVCVTLLTLGLPFFAAAAFEWGVDRLRYATEWRRAKRVYLHVGQAVETSTKRLEALIEKRDHQIKIIEERKLDALETYREHYELGRRIGAQKPAAWRVVLHIAAVVLLLAACCVLLDAWVGGYPIIARLFLYAFLTFGLGGFYAHLVLKAWDRPTPAQLYRQRAIVWRPASQAFSERNGTPLAETSPLTGK